MAFALHRLADPRPEQQAAVDDLVNDLFKKMSEGKVS